MDPKTHEVSPPLPESEAALNLPVIELTEREATIFNVIRQTAGPGVWFRRSDHDWDKVDGLVESMKSVVYPQLMKKLTAFGVIEHNGAARGGSRYKFTELIEEPLPVTLIATDSRTRVASQGQVRTPAERRVSRAESMSFAAALVVGLESRLSTSDSDRLSIESVKSYLAETLELTPRRADALIGELVGKNHFHYAFIGGAMMLKAGVAEAPLSAVTEPKSAEVDPSLWTIIDVNYAGPILEFLSHHHRLHRGGRPEEIAHDLGVSDNVQKVFYGTLHKMQAQGYLATKPPLNEVAKARLSPILYIADQELVARLLDNPQDVHQEIRSLARQDDRY